MTANMSFWRNGRRLFAAALVVVAGLAAAPSWAQTVVLRVIVLHGNPGHTSVHLTRGNEQYYWDPGGNYGQGLDDCLQWHSGAYCREWFAGFAWEDIRAARRHDVIRGRHASLWQVLAIEALDYESTTDVFTLRLDGEAAQRAWQMLHDGAERGNDAAFPTRHAPMFCTRAVTRYLRFVGDGLADLPTLWRPEALVRELHRRGYALGDSYTLHTPSLQSYINGVRHAAGIGPLALELAVGAAGETGPAASGGEL